MYGDGSVCILWLDLVRVLFRQVRMCVFIKNKRKTWPKFLLHYDAFGMFDKAMFCLHRLICGPARGHDGIRIYIHTRSSISDMFCEVISTICICTYILVYMYVYICIHTHIHTRTHIQKMHVCVHTCTRAYIQNIHACID
jgi:hypothetical protein